MHDSVRLAVAIGVLAALGAAGCGEGRVAPGDAPRARLDARQAAFFEAERARDADRVAALFTPDAVLHVANRPPIVGRDAIRQFYGGVFSFLSATTSTPETLHVAAGGEMAYATGSVVNEFRGPDGAMQYTGKYVIVWREVEGDWMLAFYGVSNNDPAAGR